MSREKHGWRKTSEERFFFKETRLEINKATVKQFLKETELERNKSGEKQG